MAIYQGIDIVNVDRLSRLIEGSAAFVEDVYTSDERAYCMGHRYPHVHFAGRFAAKEAFLKATGAGFTSVGVFRQIEVGACPSGRPVLKLSGWAGRLLRRLNASGISVSISHTPEFAVASVILSGG
ncbi:MAG: holo-ACP synthase [Candidatus Magnetominusculus sp. LBB02]|nr:holo-ACP synthase [Candidatus Magnetominusculus sp. LBB02]